MASDKVLTLMVVDPTQEGVIKALAGRRLFQVPEADLPPALSADWSRITPEDVAEGFVQVHGRTIGNAQGLAKRAPLPPLSEMLAEHATLPKGNIGNAARALRTFLDDEKSGYLRGQALASLAVTADKGASKMDRIVNLSKVTLSEGPA